MVVLGWDFLLLFCDGDLGLFSVLFCGCFFGDCLGFALGIRGVWVKIKNQRFSRIICHKTVMICHHFFFGLDFLRSIFPTIKITKLRFRFNKFLILL